MRDGTAFFISRALVRGRTIRVVGRVILSSYPSSFVSIRNPYGISRRTAQTHAHGIRQHGTDRGPSACVLGRADPTLAPALRYRARHHAAGAYLGFRRP